MGKLIVNEWLTLDGVYEGPGDVDPFVKRGWSMPYFSPEIGESLMKYFQDSEAFLLGRTTYEGFASYWPTAPDDGSGFNDIMNKTPKFVVSNSSLNLSWNNSTQIKGDLKTEIEKLKSKFSKNILMTGSGQLIQSLLPLGVIDELNLTIAPIILNSGRKLFGSGEPLSLKLLEVRSFPTGAVLLSYSL